MVLKAILVVMNFAGKTSDRYGGFEFNSCQSSAVIRKRDYKVYFTKILIIPRIFYENYLVFMVSHHYRML